MDLKGYLCGGDCIPEGDGFQYTGTLNYNTLDNWDLCDQALLQNAHIGQGDILLAAAFAGYVDLLGNRTANTRHPS